MIAKSAEPTLIFSGGHHTSALAVAQALKQRGWQIIWLGHRHSQWGDKSDSAEYREVTTSGIQFIDLKAGKLYRTYHPFKLLRLPWGFIQAFYIMLRLKLRLKSNLKGIISFGGYLGVPVVIAGWLLRLPSLSQEQTLSAGWANKVISNFAQKIAVSWPSSLSHYPADKAVLTGLPFRPDVTAVFQKNLPKQQELIYITGGKQGSHVINVAVWEILPEILTGHQVIHQTGSSTVFSDYHQAQKLKASLPKNLQNKYQVTEYLPAPTAAANLSTASVVISRAGAHIVQELLLFNTKSVLIPISWSSHSEQLTNAQLLADHNLAVILPESDLSGKNLLSAIGEAKSLQPKKYVMATDGLIRFTDLVEQQFPKN